MIENEAVTHTASFPASTPMDNPNSRRPESNDPNAIEIHKLQG